MSKTGMASAETWIYSSHYHCKKCGAEITFIKRIKWNPSCGVKAMGICGQCDKIFIEKEYSFIKGIFN